MKLAEPIILSSEERSIIDSWSTGRDLNRIHLSVLQINERAIKIYCSLGFSEEGRQRDAQFKNNRYIDVILMAILRSECKSEE